jgi:hypothetical protein
MTEITFPLRYLPRTLNKTDKIKQKRMLLRSRRLYKQGKYFTRSKLKSYHNKTSKHIKNAQRIYGLENITPNRALAKATGCSVKALRKIVNKGEGAYYSSGSRPNQTPQSWGLARLASAVTGGNAAKVDFHIIDEGCDHNKPAYKMAAETINKK